MAELFEEMMADGVNAQAAGDHQAALAWRESAFGFADAAGDDVAAARALRDMSASHGYLGDLDSARIVARDSVGILERVVDEDPSQRRELAASYERQARVMARLAIGREMDNPGLGHSFTPSHGMAKAWGLLRQSEKERWADMWPCYIDQYRINMAARSAIIKGLSRREKYSAYEMAVRSIGLGVLSESVIIDHHNEDMKFSRRMRQHALYAGLGVRAIAVVNGLHSRLSFRRQRALRTADNLLR